jgi:putative inorganic carbon (hco3(-)) transporter
MIKPGTSQNLLSPKAYAVTAASELADADMLALRPRALWRAFRAQHLGFICIAIYLILEYLKPEQAYPFLAVVPLLRFSLLGAIAGFFTDRSAKFARSPFNWLICLFVLECTLSARLAYDSDYAFSRINIITTWTIVFFLITAIVNTERRLFLFLIAYFLANFKMSQFGFFSFAHRGFGFASWGITGAGWFRNSGELGLEMSLFLAYIACFIFFLRKYWGRGLRVFMYFVALTAAACVIASSSRGAIVGVVGMLFYLSFFSKRKFRGWAALGVVLFVAYLVMPPEFLARFHAAGNDPTSMTRMTYWTHARELLHQHPWFGVGYYNWIPYYRDHFYDPKLYWRVEEAHNTYLQMGAELGYCGLVIFILMVLCSFAVNARSAALAKREGFEFLRAISIAMNAAGVSLVLASMFLTAFFLPNYWIHFALTVCVSTAVRKKIAAVEAAGDEVVSGPAEPQVALPMRPGLTVIRRTKRA